MEPQADVHPQLRLILPDAGPGCEKKWPQRDMGGHNAVGTPSGARRCSADGKIALGLQSQTSVRQAARLGRFFLAPVPKQANNEKPPSSSRRALSFVDGAILRFLLFAFAKAFQDRRAPWYQRGLIRKPLRKIGVILLHDVEHRFLGEIAMVLRK